MFKDLEAIEGKKTIFTACFGLIPKMKEWRFFHVVQ